MGESTQTKVNRLCAQAHLLAESLASLSEEFADPTEWRLRVAAGHALAVEDLLLGVSGTPLHVHARGGPSSASRDDDDDEPARVAGFTLGELPR